MLSKNARLKRVLLLGSASSSLLHGGPRLRALSQSGKPSLHHGGARLRLPHRRGSVKRSLPHGGARQKLRRSLLPLRGNGRPSLLHGGVRQSLLPPLGSARPNPLRGKRVGAYPPSLSFPSRADVVVADIKHTMRLRYRHHQPAPVSSPVPDIIPSTSPGFPLLLTTHSFAQVPRSYIV